MSDLIERLQSGGTQPDESDLCRMETATDIADLLSGWVTPAETVKRLAELEQQLADAQHELEQAKQWAESTRIYRERIEAERDAARELARSALRQAEQAESVWRWWHTRAEQLEAQLAACQAEKKHFGEFAVLNFPMEAK